MKNLECEAHIIISYQDYLSIIEDIPHILKDNHINNIKNITQENIYYDDIDNNLSKQKITFRLRKILSDNIEELTLKIPSNNGDIEINETPFHHPEIDSHLPKPFSSYQEVARLLTKRIEIEFENYLLVLDENKYHGVVDYDIEIESKKDLKNALEILEQYVNKYHIKYDKDTLTQSKAKRARLANKK